MSDEEYAYKKVPGRVYFSKEIPVQTLQGQRRGRYASRVLREADRTRVLLFHHLWQAASTGQFYGSRQGWKLDSTLPPFTMQPIRWRHLPSPPTPEGTQP